MAAKAQQKARHILQLSLQEQKEFLDSFDLLLSDCDGVLWLLVEPLPLTGEAINRLRQGGKRCIFVSNNNMRTEEEYLQTFADIGVTLKIDEVMYPVRAMLSYLNKNLKGQRIYSASSYVATDAFRANGYDVESLEVPPRATPPIMEKLVRPKHKVAAVVYDINLNLTYGQLAKAIQYLKDPDCVLISGGADTLLPLASDMNLPGFIDFLDHIERYSNKKSIALGKPSPALGHILKEEYDIRTPSRCIFVGDVISQDIAFGISCGYQTLLVLSGATSKEQMLATKVEQQPDYYADSLADFLQLYKNLEDANLIDI